jgi:rubrerythrin
MELQRCRFCGEVYYGEKPSHCPHCGASKKFMLPIGLWKEENRGVEISEKTREILRQAQALEFYNTRFYRAASATENAEISGYFKYLSKIEGEHYSVLTKLLGEEKNPEISGKEDSKGSDFKNLTHSEEREELASALYEEFTDQVSERRVKEIFLELTKIENDHLKLDKLELQKLKAEKTA